MGNDRPFNFVLERIRIPETFVFDKPECKYMCGRGKENFVVCNGLTVSRKHCVFHRKKDSLYVTDLKSSNGLFINGIAQESLQTIELKEDDIVGIGCPDIHALDNDMYAYKICVRYNTPQTESDEAGVGMQNTGPIELGHNNCQVLKRKREKKSTDVVPSKIPKVQNSENVVKPSAIAVDTDKSNKITLTKSKKKPITLNKKDTDDIEIIHLSSSKELPDVTSITEKQNNIENSDVTQAELDNTDKREIVNRKKRSNILPNKKCEQLNQSLPTNSNKKQLTSSVNTAQKQHTNVNENNPSSCQTNKNKRKKKSASNASQKKKIEQNPGVASELQMSNEKDSIRNAETENKSVELKIPKAVSSDIMPEIKMEDELQITDDEERNIWPSANMAKSPLKLKLVKEEPKTRFSEIDVVNLSDDDSDVFPCSQLFDTEFGTEASVKKEIKQELNENEDNRFNHFDTTDIIYLSDSEDEDDLWLHRLSRSQILNESNELGANTGGKEALHNLKEQEEVNEAKVDIDFLAKTAMNDIKSTDELAEVSCTSEINKLPSVKETKEIDTETSKADTSHLTPTKKIDTQEEAAVLPSLSKEKCQLKENLIANIVELTARDSHENTSTNTACSGTNSKNKLPLEKKIPQIEPPHMPKRRRSSSVSSKDFFKIQLASRLTTKEKMELKQKNKIEKHLYNKEQKHRKLLNKWADCLPPGKSKKVTLTTEEKKLLADSRKEKLKQLAEEKKTCPDVNTEKKRMHKVKAKVTTKTRGYLLIADQLGVNVDKSPAIETERTDTTKPSNTSSVSKTSVNGQHGDASSKEIVNKVTKNLQQTLKISDLPKMIKIPKKKITAATDSNASGTTATISSSAIASEDTVDILGKILKEQTLSLQNTKVDVNSTEKPQPQLAATDNVSTSLTDKLLTVTPAAPADNKRKSCIRTSIGTKKKRVTFCTNIQSVREYVVETQTPLRKVVGKDLPVPADKLSRSSQRIVHRKLDVFLLRIFSWNPVWLEEQSRLNSMPPIVRDDELYPLLSRYKSYDEYYRIVEPLLLLEIWSIITSDFEGTSGNQRRPTKMCTIVPNSITKQDVSQTNLFYTSLMVEILLTKEEVQRQAYPTYGDLVMFEFQTAEKDKKVFHKVFAYINNVCQTNIQATTHYNKILNNYVKHPHTLMTYTLITRPLCNITWVNQALRLRAVSYLRASLRLVRALQYLPKSPLMKHVLNPQIEAYKLPYATEGQTRLFVTKDTLNAKQKEAVLRVSETVLQKEPKICFIQGPPGTGKSRVIVNIVTQIIYGGGKYRSNPLRILLCAPSNTAIDEIVLRLLSVRRSMPKSERFKMVRIGRLDSMHPGVRDISAMNLGKRYAQDSVPNYSNAAPLDSLEQEKLYLEAKINGLKFALANSQSTPDADKSYNKAKLTELITKYSILVSRTVTNDVNAKQSKRTCRSAEIAVIKNADIIACTLSSCFTEQMESIFGNSKEKIPVCIVDEATQSCEAETLIPLMLGVNTLVLVGDTNQLPATILNTQAKRLGLDQSIFSRVQSVFEECPNNPIIMLNTQYRMVYPISCWPNKYFYRGELRNEAKPLASFPFHAYRVLNLNARQNSDKFQNTGEAEFVATMIVCMMQYLENWESILSLGILTPYTKQKNIVTGKINEKIALVPSNLRKKIIFEVNTVDGFQGQERDIIIMSCVRSEGIGFLSDRQRLCVALTRAKHSLILCGNFHTFMKDEMWKALLNDAQSRKVYHTINVNSDTVINEIIECVVKHEIRK